MKFVRWIIKRLPAWWRDRIDLETRGIRQLMQTAARELPSGCLILDAGAGQAPYREMFSRQRYIALDFAKGESAWDYSGLDAVGNLESLPFPSETFDAAVSTQVLEHVPDPGKILREIHRVLKPGAPLYITAPLGFGEHQQPYDFYRYTRYGLRHLLTRAGFRIETLKPRGGFFWYMAVMGMWFYLYFFPPERSLVWKIILLPLQIPAAFWFILIAPPLISSLDFLDHEKAITLGFAGIARKNSPETAD